MGQRFGKYTSGDTFAGASQIITESLNRNQRGKISRAELAEKMRGRKASEKTEANKLALETKKFETGLPYVERSVSGGDPTKALTPDVETAPQGSPSQDLQQANQEVAKYEQVAMSEVTPGEIVASEVMLTKRMESLGVKNFKEPAKEIAEFAKQMKGQSKFTIYNKTKQNWHESLKLSGLDKIKQSMATATLEETARLTKLYNAWDSGDVVNEMFPNCVAHENQLMNRKAPDAPKTIQEGLARNYANNPEKLEELYKYAKNSKGKGAGRFPDDIKTMLELTKILGKKQYSAQDLIMLNVFDIDPQNEKQTEKQKTMYENLIDNIAKRAGLKVNNTKKKVDKTKKSWKDYQ